MAYHPRVRLDYRPHPLRFLRSAQLSRLLNVNEATLWRWWARDGILPPPIELSPGVKGWREEVVKRWLDERAEVADEENDGEE